MSRKKFSLQGMVTRESCANVDMSFVQIFNIEPVHQVDSKDSGTVTLVRLQKYFSCLLFLTTAHADACVPIVGLFFRHSSEKFFANRRKNFSPIVGKILFYLSRWGIRKTISASRWCLYCPHRLPQKLVLRRRAHHDKSAKRSACLHFSSRFILNIRFPVRSML